MSNTEKQLFSLINLSISLSHRFFNTLTFHQHWSRVQTTCVLIFYFPSHDDDICGAIHKIIFTLADAFFPQSLEINKEKKFSFLILK
jgi:hypothetical protein